MTDFFKKIRLGGGYLDDVEKAKFLLSRSFTPQDLIAFYKMSDKVFQYVLARMAITNTLRLN